MTQPSQPAFVYRLGYRTVPRSLVLILGDETLHYEAYVTGPEVQRHGWLGGPLAC